MRLASPEFVKECLRVFTEYRTGKMTKAQFEEACLLLETAARQGDKNALEPTEDELRYAARA